MVKTLAAFAAFVVALSSTILTADARPIWVAGEWHEPENGTVWVADRDVWWQRSSGNYWVRGWWRDGAGRFWTAERGWFVWEAYVPTASPGNAAAASSGASYAGSGVERWRPLVASVFPAGVVDYVLNIMRCESNGNPNATGGAGERGLMQIHPLHYDSTYDPYGNLLAAYRISNGGRNFSAWSCA